MCGMPCYLPHLYQCNLMSFLHPGVLPQRYEYLSHLQCYN